ncbi:hypothetical protein AEA09_16405 [Lysinibacillus contaminans]|uniref:Lipoprotein n=1 Tax=Lysinibacillus contaminans TaxID=1293441 RepID=A0ABR5JWD0_9BACI|nr:hypothetical protein [Lysinibacillus contaminans]KOS66333.1 hypothetical protein AEA09_16405 [Lysinibacillus contaminans]
MNSVGKLTLATIFLVILLLFACQANDLMFVGEGENWSSKVTVNQIDGYETYQMQINYKGQSIQDIEAFSYYVETKNSGVIGFSANNVSLNKEGIYQKDLPISNSPSTSGKDELVIKVEWNGNSEDFTLINK